MITKKIKRRSAFVLSAVLAFAAMALPNVYAALGVDTDAKCSVEINVTGVQYKELNGTDDQVEVLPVTVNLYKVADIDVTGTYTAVPSLETLDFSGLSSETKAAEWEALAEAAQKEVIEDQMEATATAVTEDGVALVNELETGLYLIDAQQVLSANYQYEFIPYLISLPNNYFYNTDSGDDTWIYDQTGRNAIGLKPERTERVGDLVIRKELDVYNATIGGATFVFQVEGSKTDIDTGETRVVYSDVLSMTFKNPGTDSLTIEDLAAGYVVSVTEIYTGRSYSVTSEESQTVMITADQVITEFDNTYDTRLNGGNGVVNTFSYNSETKEWMHAATEDSTP